MSRDDLTVRQRAVLFALLGEARAVANPELEQLIGVRLDGAERRDLNDRRLVESTRAGRAFAHELSDAGWRWCAQELAAASARRGSSLERAHYRVFAVFARYLDAAGLSLANIVRPEAEAEAEAETEAEADLTACIEAGYRSLAAGSGEFVSLRELRLRLPGRPRPTWTRRSPRCSPRSGSTSFRSPTSGPSPTRTARRRSASAASAST